MIQFPRSFARELRSVFRRCARKTDKFKPSVVGFQATAITLRVRLVLDEACVECLSTGSYETETLQLSLSALDDFQGRGDDPVRLSVVATDRCMAEWLQGGVPRAMEYELPNPKGEVCFPGQPASCAENPPTILEALAAASEVAATEGIRYGIHRICLSGKRGEVAATDGRQLLVQNGFQFPWEEDLLVTNLHVWGSREIASDKSVRVGRTKEHVVLRIGDWAFWLLIDSNMRYPAYREILARPSMNDSIGQIDPLDRDFLVRALPNLPCDDDDSSITVDLNGTFCVRAKSQTQSRPTELVLARSTCSGKPVRFRMNRDHLARMADLGFAEFHVADPEKPTFCQDEQRTYVTMPYGQGQTIPPGNEVLRVSSTDGITATRNVSTKRRRTMEPSTSNGNAANEAPGITRPSTRSKNGTGKADLVAEAESLCAAIGNANSHASRLLKALKRRKKQSKLVATTLASLKELQSIEG